MASYKSIHKAIEECIIPMVIRKLIYSHIAACPEKAKLWDKALHGINLVMTREFLSVAPKLRPSFESIINTVAEKVVRHMIKNGFRTTKGFMVMVLIGQDRVLPSEIEILFDEVTNDIAGKLWTEDYDKDLDAVLDSARKQAPKVLGVIQKLGYFRG